VSAIIEVPHAAEARAHVAALYQAHALGLVKLAVLMVGDQRTAEDIVPRLGVRQDPVDQEAGLLTNGIFTPVKFPLADVPLAGEIAF